MCRKIGCTNVVDVDRQEGFILEIAKYVDSTAGLAGLLGKSTLPKILVDLFIIDWESPETDAAELIRTVKGKYSGNYRFLVVADKRHAAEMSKAFGAGATDAILKPFTSAEFKEKLDNVLADKPLTVLSYSLGKPKEEKKPASQKRPAPASITGPKTEEILLPPPPPLSSGVITQKFPAPPPQPQTGKGGGGPSFYTAARKKTQKGDAPTATLINGQINGHYHEKVDVIGGGENCYWAMETPDGKVHLEYLSAKGTASGVEAKIIERNDFLFHFYLCEEYGCQILRRLGKWPTPEA